MKKEKEIVSSCVSYVIELRLKHEASLLRILDFGKKNNKMKNFIFPEFRILKSQEKREIKCLFLSSVRLGTLVGAKKQTLQYLGSQRQNSKNEYFLHSRFFVFGCKP